MRRGHTSACIQFFKAYTTWSLSHEVRSCRAVHAAVGFVLQIIIVALALALPTIISVC